MEEFKIDGYDYTFRVKDMNAIEILAMESLMDFTDMESSITTIYYILECLEVKVNDSWLPVKTKKMDLFYPTGLEKNYDLTKKLTKYFINDFLKPVFQKSNGSKE